ncbi:serine protease [Cohnella kolymensis]|uniref:Serine protease n=1 Tax=Cohnella kolymensis TaxID=1590652 RepID=A0ABR5A5M8_9BACL|nr:trypsin-like peptidase domain-containing protein [Cohnella kolymensis]KIL36332.1 serine protease [Cohnella kolymensis]
MSFFDDDFFSTRVTRRSLKGARTGSRRSRGIFKGPMFRVAFISSLVSSLLVVALFLALNRTGASGSGSKAAFAGGETLVETSERMISASAKVRPAVVSIINLTEQVKMPKEEDMLPNSGEIPENASLGSGVIFQKKDGEAFIITNAHVIQDAVKVQAVLMNGDKKEAKIVGKDTITDLAVLSVDDEGIDTVVDIGNSEKLRVGEMVIAIGNPLGFFDSSTQGIISSTHRIIPISLNQDGNYDWEQEVIQTDAAINQGNSGGALVDLNGRLVGINSMKLAEMGVEGIGFAIPVDDAMPVIDALMEHGKVTRPYLGVYSMDLASYLDGASAPGTEEGGDQAEPDDLNLPEDVKEGVLVLEAVGPALEAGLKLNDVIVELDGKPIGTTMDLRKYLYNHKKIGESLEVTYYRDGKKETVELELTEKKDEEQ